MKLYTVEEVFIKETEDFPQNYTGMIESDDGTKRWYKSQLMHRDNDLPAVIKTNGHKSWFQNGKHHRKNNPAFIEPNGDYKWYVEGEQHRLDGPAESRNNNLYYWQNDKLHRTDGPAVIIINESWAKYIGFLPKKKAISVNKDLNEKGISHLWFLNFKLHSEESVKLYSDMLKLKKPK